MGANIKLTTARMGTNSRRMCSQTQSIKSLRVEFSSGPEGGFKLAL